MDYSLSLMAAVRMCYETVLILILMDYSLRNIEWATKTHNEMS